MAPENQYEMFACECTRMAIDCRDQETREVLMDMARHWMAVAMGEPGTVKPRTCNSRLDRPPRKLVYLLGTT